MTISDLWHSILTFRKLPEVLTLAFFNWLARYVAIVANLVVVGVSWVPETEYITHFLHRSVYSTSGIKQGYLPSLTTVDFFDEIDVVPKQSKIQSDSLIFPLVLRRLVSKHAFDRPPTPLRYGKYHARASIKTDLCSDVPLKRQHASLIRRQCLGSVTLRFLS